MACCAVNRGDRENLLEAETVEQIRFGNHALGIDLVNGHEHRTLGNAQTLRDLFVERLMTGGPDLAHTAGPQLPREPVTPEVPSSVDLPAENPDRVSSGHEQHQRADEVREVVAELNGPAHAGELFADLRAEPRPDADGDRVAQHRKREGHDGLLPVPVHALLHVQVLERYIPLG